MTMTAPVEPPAGGSGTDGTAVDKGLKSGSLGLVGSGVVQIVAVTDPLQVGFARQAMIGIKAEGNLDPVVEALSAMDEVDYVVITAGSFDILVEVVCEDDAHLLSLLNERIRTIDGVRSTESFLYLKLSKQTYTWGTR